MSKRCLWILLSVLLTAIAHCQVAGQTGWKLVRDPGAKATYAATDLVGDVYVAEQLSASSSVLNVFGPYGALIKSYPISGPITGLAVDPPTGTACVGQSGAILGFDWDGYAWTYGVSGSMLAMGMDREGASVSLFAGGGFTNLEVSDGFLETQITLLFDATSGYVDDRGRCLLVGSTTSKAESTTTANFYDEDGTLLWTRSYSHTPFTGERFAGIAVDGRGYCYLPSI